MKQQQKKSFCRILITAVLFSLPASAATWDYPTPGARCDVKDISFYEPCGQAPLPSCSAGRPRRIIFLIGDGMGFNQVQLARQTAIGSGGRLHMESLPVYGAVSTHSANNPVTDSAAAATALACGVKTNNRMIGMTPDQQMHPSILEILEQKGWRTGIVVTSTLSHATPAGFVAHVEERGMETEIAAQMLHSGADVLFGGGRAYWIAKGGLRKDDRSLTAEAGGAGFQVIYNRLGLAELKPGRALGLFAEKEMTTFAPEPSLSEMTQKAIELLSAESSEWFAPSPRFFLMVEGSQIDWACHDNNTDNTIRQVLLFDMAVKEALAFAVRDKQTLVIVTADHETGGLTLHENKEDNRLKAHWSSKDHTGVSVPLFAYGPGAERFGGRMDNTDLFGKLMDLSGKVSASAETSRQSRSGAAK